jgi:hypothetical protein
MSDTVLIILIIAAAIVVVVFIFRRQLSRLVIKANKEGFEGTLETRKTGPSPAQNSAALAAGGASVGHPATSEAVQVGSRNSIRVRFATWVSRVLQVGVGNRIDIGPDESNGKSRR